MIDDRWVAAGSPGLCSWKWLLDVDGLLHLALHVVLFSVYDSQIIQGDTVTGGITVVSYPSQSIQFTMFLEPYAEGSLRLPNVGVVGVVDTRDVVHGAAQYLLGGFVLKVYEH